MASGGLPTCWAALRQYKPPVVLIDDKNKVVGRLRQNPFASPAGRSFNPRLRGFQAVKRFATVAVRQQPGLGLVPIILNGHFIYIFCLWFFTL
jgi:hypothetical protein